MFIRCEETMGMTWEKWGWRRKVWETLKQVSHGVGCGVTWSAKRWCWSTNAGDGELTVVKDIAILRNVQNIRKATEAD